MNKYICPGDTIEGDEVHVVSRKILPLSMVRHSAVKKNMYVYNTDRNSTASVEKTHQVSENEDVQKETAEYHRNIGDTLQCDGLKVFADQRRPNKIEHTEGVTGTHGANFTTFKVHTIAKIQTPLKMLEKSIQKIEAQRALDAQKRLEAKVEQIED